MTDEFTECVRGCKRPCRAEHCLTTGRHDHDPLPRRADVGMLCKRCSDQLLQAVSDIPDLYAQLPPLSDIGHGTGERIAHGKISGSPALIRLDVMVLQGHGFEGDGVMPVLQTVGGWSLIIEEELGAKPTNDSLTAMAEVMRRYHHSICRQPWVDEYWSDLVSILGALRRATNAPKPIGRCFGRIANRPCGQPLYEPVPPATDIVCPDVHCGRTYTGSELYKLQIQAEREAS